MEARDLAVGLTRGRIAIGPVRGWLQASALIDHIDAAACVLARDHIRTGVFPGAVGLAGTGALLTAWLPRRLDARLMPAREP